MKTKLLALLIALICIPCYGQPVWQTLPLDEWESVAQNAVREGTEQNINMWDNVTVYISCALNSGTAHTGTEILVQVSPADSGDEMWITQASMTTMIGTASSTVMSYPANAASLTFAVSTLPGNFTADGVRTIFLLGSPTIANSELCTLVSHISGAASSVTVMDALTNTVGGSSTFYNITSLHVVEIPPQMNRLRIVYDNTFDSNGATCWTYSAITGKKR
jgi:hypothetical protein